MADARNWLLALSRFDALRVHPPGSWDEGAVSEFHQILAALEKASGEDLSSFRVPDREMKQRVIAANYRHGTTTMSDKRYCDEQYMRRQLEGIALYFQNLQPPPESRKMGF